MTKCSFRLRRSTLIQDQQDRPEILYNKHFTLWCFALQPRSGVLIFASRMSGFHSTSGNCTVQISLPVHGSLRSSKVTQRIAQVEFPSFLSVYGGRVMADLSIISELVGTLLKR